MTNSLSSSARAVWAHHAGATLSRKKGGGVSSRAAAYDRRQLVAVEPVAPRQRESERRAPLSDH
jgi:hypothetical protein